MTWIIILAIIVCVGVAVKVILHRRLKSIDGFNGIHTEDMNKNGEKIIVTFGAER